MSKKSNNIIAGVLIAIIIIMATIAIKSIDTESKDNSQLDISFQCNNNKFEYYIVKDKEYDTEYIVIQGYRNQSNAVAIIKRDKE